VSSFTLSPFTFFREGDSNLYGYVFENPVNYIDSSGLAVQVNCNTETLSSQTFTSLEYKKFIIDEDYGLIGLARGSSVGPNLGTDLRITPSLSIHWDLWLTKTTTYLVKIYRVHQTINTGITTCTKYGDCGVIDSWTQRWENPLTPWKELIGERNEVGPTKLVRILFSF